MPSAWGFNHGDHNEGTRRAQRDAFGMGANTADAFGMGFHRKDAQELNHRDTGDTKVASQFLLANRTH